MNSLERQDTEEYQPRCDFASLTPANVYTALGFNRLRAYLLDNPGHHYGQYVNLDCKRDLPDPQRTLMHHSFSTEDATTDEDDDDNDLPMPGETGVYILSFIPNAVPRKPERGWMVGAGHADGRPDEIDLLLSNPAIDRSNKKRSKIYPRHAYFRFDEEGRLWLHARHPGVTIDGVAISRHRRRQLPAVAVITFGPLRYQFRWTIESKEADSILQSYKHEYLSRHLGALEDFTSLAATPTVADTQIGPWILHGVIAHSQLSIIHAASHVEHGTVVAVKCLLRSSSSRLDTRTRAELDIYESLQKPLNEHPDGEFVMKQFAVITERNRSHEIMYETYLLWQPLALGDFGRFMVSQKWHQTPQLVKLDLFCQALLGLKALNDLGWMHRDLKPGNLCAVSLLESAPQAIVIDLGQATRYTPGCHPPQPQHCGTIGYLAPELENGYYADPACYNRHTEKESYDPKVDIWSMGAVAVNLFHGGILPWTADKNIFRAEPGVVYDQALQSFLGFQRLLALAPENSLDGLIHCMLQRKARDRSDIGQVLSHPALQKTLAGIRTRQNAKQDAGRFDAMPVTGSKRRAALPKPP
nr:isoform b of serine/threonine-protein kinase chk-1 [Quercus suber]